MPNLTCRAKSPAFAEGRANVYHLRLSLGFPGSTPQGRLLATMLAGIAEFERELIKERTGAGRKRAMARGVKFGRKPKMTPFQRPSLAATVPRRSGI